MKRFSKLLLLVVMVAMGVGLPNGVTARAAQTTPVTVSWSVWGSEQELVSHRRVADAFMVQYPNIKVDVRHLPWEKYHDQIKVWIASGDPALIPDVMWLGQDFERYHEAGILENLSPWIAKTKYDVGDYWPQLIDRASYPEGVFGLQRDLDLRVLYYNKDVFDKAGVGYPTDKWTWDDWAAAAKTLTVKDASGATTRYGIGVEAEKFDMLLLQNGGALIDDIRNPSRCMLTTPQSLEAVNFFAGLMNNGYAMRIADLDKAGGDGQAFLMGKVAMIIQNSSRALDFNQARMNYDVAPIPIPKAGKRVNNNDGARFVMSGRSLHKEETWLFLSWLQSKAGGQSVYTATGEIFPALKSVATSDVFLKIPQKPANRAAYNIEAGGGTFLVLGDFGDFGDLNDSVVVPSLRKIWDGEGKPEEIAANICDRTDDFLRQAGYPKQK